MRKAALILFLLACYQAMTAQPPVKPGDKISSRDKMTASLEDILLIELNKVRKAHNLDTLEIEGRLDSASGMQAEYQAQHFKVTTSNGGGTAARMKKVGATKNAEELAGSAPTYKGSSPIPAAETAKILIEKWMKSKNEKAIILNGMYVLSGISARVDKNYKKVYVSVVFGNHYSFNTGAKKKKEIRPSYSTKQFKLKSADKQNCRNCDKFKDYEKLYSGIYVENGKVYLKYDNLKQFKKLMKRSKDGLAIDIVSRDQYSKESYNIYDNNLVSKGILLKRVYAPAIYKKNRIKGKKITAVDICLGSLPKNLPSQYELNLLIIQNNRVCRVLTRTYTELGDQDSQTKLDMLLWPDSNAYFKPQFEPKSETNILTFKIPFERNKFDYKPEDMEPFLKALQEPDFFIEGLYIYAYSSIEGDSAANAKLQKKRAESIIGALQKMQKGEIETTIMTNDSWDLFLLDMEGTQWEYLTQKPKREAIKEINSKGLAPQMEEYLSQQRFAQIVMDITYDISGEKEQKFCTFQFNKSVKKNDLKQALKIQYYIEKSVRNNKYQPSVLKEMTIPFETKYSPLLMNRIVYRYYYNKKEVTRDDYTDLDYLSKLDPKNDYITYNAVFCKVKMDSNFHEKGVIDGVQKQVDALYKGQIPKKYVDALNIELQFRIMDACDTLEGAEPIVAACIARIKSFYNLKEASWQNALKLAYQVMQFKDYRFACSVMEPYLQNPALKLSEDFYFAYISACSHVPEKVVSRNFAAALRKAKEKNPSRYCKLFGEPYLSFQVLDNPEVKKDYFGANCGK
ncbi:MAG: CAP domain-containing protein [Bacteroidota bacterium]